MMCCELASGKKKSEGRGSRRKTLNLSAMYQSCSPKEWRKKTEKHLHRSNPEAQAQKSPNLNSCKTTPPKSAQASSCWLLPPAFSPRVFSAFQFPESRPSAEHGAGRNGRKTRVLCLQTGGLVFVGREEVPRCFCVAPSSGLAGWSGFQFSFAKLHF